MPVQIKAEALTATRFAPFGDVLDFAGKPDKIINQGMCGRFHNRAKVTHIDGQSGISLFVWRMGRGEETGAGGRLSCHRGYTVVGRV